MVVLRKGDSANEGALNAVDFIKKKAEDIPVDQMFFHRFFTKKQENEKTRDAKKTENKRKRRGDADVDDSDIDIDDEDIEMGGEDSDAESGAEEEDGELEAVEEGDLDEDEVWKAMQASMPPAGGDAEDADLLEASDDDSVADFAYSDSDVGVDEDTTGAVENDNEEEEEEEAEEEVDEPQSFFPEDDEDGMEDFGEEEEDFFDSDEDIVLGDGVEIPTAEDEEGASRKQKKRKLKHLPAFASADDWAELINAGDADEE
jgi:ribosome biogenesis protein MAK21